MRRYNGETVRINGDYDAVDVAIEVFAVASDIARWDFTIALFYAQKNAVRQYYRAAFFIQTNNLNHLNPVSAQNCSLWI